MAICHGCKGNGLTDDGAVCVVCKGAGTNGVDLSIDKGRIQDALRAAQPPPCCKRIGNGVWCTRPDRHDGDCANREADPVYGPIEARPPLWRDRRGMQQPAAPAPAKTTEPSGIR
jgi:hypothetical protein